MKEKIVEQIIKIVLNIRRSILKKKDYHLLSLIDTEYSMKNLDNADVSSKGNNFDVEEISVFDIIDRDDIRKTHTKITKFFYDNRPQKAIYFQDINSIEKTLLDHANGGESIFNQLGVIEISEKNPFSKKVKHIQINIVGTTKNYVMIEFRAGLEGQYRNELSSYFMNDIVEVKERIELTKHANPFKLSSWSVGCPSKISQKRNQINNEIKGISNDISKFLINVFPLELSNIISNFPLVRVNTEILPATTGLEMFWDSIGYDDRFTLFLSKYRIAWQYAGDSYGLRIINRNGIDGLERIYVDHNHPDHTLVPYYLILQGIKEYADYSFSKVREFQNSTTKSLRKNVDSDFIEIQKLYYKANRMIQDFKLELGGEELSREFEVTKQSGRVSRFGKQLNWINESLELIGDRLYKETIAIETMINLMQSIYSRKLNRNVLILTFVSVIIGAISIMNSIDVSVDKSLLDKLLENFIKLGDWINKWFIEMKQ